MNAVLQVDGAGLPDSREPKGQNDRNTLDRREILHRAALTLRAIRQRYEIGRNTYPDVLCHSVQFAVGSSDMAWITAAIEILETNVLDATRP